MSTVTMAARPGNRVSHSGEIRPTSCALRCAPQHATLQSPELKHSAQSPLAPITTSPRGSLRNHISVVTLGHADKERVPDPVCCYPTGEGRRGDCSCTAAIDLQPDVEILAAAYVSRSVDLILLERTDEAIADVTAAIDLQPDDIDILAQAYVNRSIALSTLQRTDDAVADLRIVLELLPPTMS